MQSDDHCSLLRKCPDCNETKSRDQFPRGGTYCKPCHNRRTRASMRRNGGSRRYHLRQRYGLEPDDVEALIRDQSGVCAICMKRPATQVDHDHNTGIVRGILCIYCNSAMGAFRDSPIIMSNAIEYLEKHRA
jgi:hypothetical protein